MERCSFFFHPVSIPDGKFIKIRTYERGEGVKDSSALDGTGYTSNEIECGRKELAELFEKAGLEKYSDSCSRNMIRGISPGSSEIMGIINMTPDSFFAGSRKSTNEEIMDLIHADPDYLDIGGESTRPGSALTDPLTEQERLSGHVEFLRDNFKKKISLDSRNIETVERFIDSIDMVNDISGLADKGIAELSAEHGKEYVLMHIRGTPQDMESHTKYQNLMGEMSEFFISKLLVLQELNVMPEKIILDPGIGFAKDFNANLEIVRNPWVFNYGFKRLFGHSRKRFLGNIGGNAVEKRLPETISATIFLSKSGVEILRVHDVIENKAALRGFSLFGGFSTR